MRCSPRKSFFEWLRRLSTDEREQERLDEFLADPDEIFTYATRPARTIVETLADFREVRLPLSHILEILPPLRRRQFSIASSWGAHPGKIQLLIALVEYKTNLKIPRRGLCSSWLATLAEGELRCLKGKDELTLGTRLPVKINAPTLFLPEPEVPVILVGPGTGVAPMRAFVEERVRQGAASREYDGLTELLRANIVDSRHCPVLWLQIVGKRPVLQSRVGRLSGEGSQSGSRRFAGSGGQGLCAAPRQTG